MAHFAQIDKDGIVVNVIVVNNSELLDGNGLESEEKGREFCGKLFGGEWVQTSYNNNFRKRYAGIGYKYNKILDSFIRPKPFNSWIFDENTSDWNPPTPYPNDGKIYTWDENLLNWIEV